MTQPSIATLGAPPYRLLCSRCGVPFAPKARRIQYVADDPRKAAHCIDCRPYLKEARP